MRCPQLLEHGGDAARTHPCVTAGTARYRETHRRPDKRQSFLLPQWSHSTTTCTGQWVADMTRFLVFPKEPGCVRSSLSLHPGLRSVIFKENKDERKWRGLHPPSPGSSKGCGWPPPSTRSTRRRGSCKGPAWGRGVQSTWEQCPPSTKQPSFPALAEVLAKPVGHPTMEALWSSPGLPCPHRR